MKDWFLSIVDPVVAEAFGWSLIHSIWQGLIIALLLFLVLKFSYSFISHSVRYWMAYVSLIAVVILTVFNFWNGMNTAPTISDQPENLVITVVEENISEFEELGSFEYISSFVDKNINVFVSFWLLGFIVFVIKLVGGYSYLTRLKDGATRVDASISSLASEMATKLRLGQNWDVVESAIIKVPAVFGHIRPLIFLPVGMTSELTVDQLKAIFAHEMAHIKRDDYLFNLFQSFVEAVYFFNPFVWWISEMIRAEREMACDDLALKVSTCSRSYVEGLIKVNELSLINPPVFALGVTGNNKNSLMDRIKRIMNTDMDKRPKELLPLILMAAAFVVPAYFLALNLKDDRPSIPPNIAGIDTSVPFVVAKRNVTDLDLEFFRNSLNLPTRSFGLDTLPIKIETLTDIHEELAIDIKAAISVEAIDIAVDAVEEMEIAMSLIPILEAIDLPLPLVLPISLNGLDTIPHKWEDENFKIFTNEWKDHMRLLQEQMRVFGEEFEMEFLKEFEVWKEEHARDMEMMTESLRDHLESMETDLDMDRLMRVEKEMLERLEEINMEEFGERLDERMKELAERLSQMPDLEEELRQMEETLKAELSHLKEFENDLTEMLIKDGYIEKGEELNIEFDDEEVKINGKTIKEKDAKKYLDLRKKHFPRDRGNFRYRIND